MRLCSRVRCETDLLPHAGAYVLNCSHPQGLESPQDSSQILGAVGQSVRRKVGYLALKARFGSGRLPSNSGPSSSAISERGSCGEAGLWRFMCQTPSLFSRRKRVTSSLGAPTEVHSIGGAWLFRGCLRDTRPHAQQRRTTTVGRKVAGLLFQRCNPIAQNITHLRVASRGLYAIVAAVQHASPSARRVAGTSGRVLAGRLALKQPLLLLKTQALPTTSAGMDHVLRSVGASPQLPRELIVDRASVPRELPHKLRRRRSSGAPPTPLQSRIPKRSIRRA